MSSLKIKLSSVLLLIIGMGFYLPVCSQSNQKIYELESTLKFAEDQRKELRDRIESMKCCDNCKHSVSMSEIGINYVRPCFDCDDNSEWVKE